MELNGTRLGRIIYDASELLTLPSGLIGMPQLKHFLVLDFEDSVPYKWLQSVDEPGLGFIIAEPELFRQDFSLALDEDEISDLETKDPRQLVIFSLCTYDQESGRITGNLRGPVLVNTERRLGQQVVVAEDGYGTHECLNLKEDPPKIEDVKEHVAEHHG